MIETIGIQFSIHFTISVGEGNHRSRLCKSLSRLTTTEIMNNHLIDPLSFESENKPKLLRLKLFVIVYFIEPKTKTSM